MTHGSGACCCFFAYCVTLLLSSLGSKKKCTNQRHSSYLSVPERHTRHPLLLFYTLQTDSYYYTLHHQCTLSLMLDPYETLDEAVLPSVEYCTTRKMLEVQLVVPVRASSFRPGCLPLNALNPDIGCAFWSKPDDAAPYFEAKIGEGRHSPVSLIILHAADEEAGHGRGVLSNIEPRLLDKNGDVVWAGPVTSVSSHEQGEKDRLMVFVPGVTAHVLQVYKHSATEGLGLRAVQVFVMPSGKYTLSRTILTIDKYAVPQPFSLTELAANTAYNNLFTSSACHELATQESFCEEKLQDAVNLAHHLQAIWDPVKRKFNHGQHVRTVQVILLGLIDIVKNMLATEPRALVDVPGPCYVLGDIHGNFQDLLYFTSNLIAFRHIKYCAHSFVFLGDYVDRGPHDVECLAYLLSLKVQAPNKVILLRGNHEDRRQNSHLTESFQAHCISLFGQKDGMHVWDKANDLFEYFPVCGVINEKVFCCHGGVPQVPRNEEKVPMRIRDVLSKVKLPIRLVCPPLFLGGFFPRKVDGPAGKLRNTEVLKGTQTPHVAEMTLSEQLFFLFNFREINLLSFVFIH